MVHGGRALLKPLPIDLGTNENNAYGLLTSALTALEPIGMKWCRSEIPWNYNAYGSLVGFETTVGVYSSSLISFLVSEASIMSTYNFKPLWLFNSGTSPGLSSTWSSGVPVTPAQFGTAAGQLVSMLAAQGLTGQHFELFNEPDNSGGQPITPALLVAAFQAAYPAMKSADPTCIVHCAPMENFANNAAGQGILYKTSCFSALPTFYEYYDIDGFHAYCPNGSYTSNVAPNSINAYGVNFAQGVGNWKAAKIANEDNTPCWITEFGWGNGGNGGTPQNQRQWLWDALILLSGIDPINGGQFSSWLKCAIQFAADNQGAYWGIMGGTDDNSIAIPVLTEVVAGN